VFFFLFLFFDLIFFFQIIASLSRAEQEQYKLAFSKKFPLLKMFFEQLLTWANKVMKTDISIQGFLPSKQPLLLLPFSSSISQSFFHSRPHYKAAVCGAC
jgi:hypothetical protein